MRLQDGLAAVMLKKNVPAGSPTMPATRSVFCTRMPTRPGVASPIAGMGPAIRSLS